MYHIHVHGFFVLRLDFERQSPNIFEQFKGIYEQTCDEENHI